MNLEISKKEEVATLEANEKPEASAIETKKSDQEFAAEILSKIENEMNSELSSHAEIQKIDSSIGLTDPTIKEKIKNDLDLENKFTDLDNETKIAGEEAKYKISEISGFSKAYHHPQYRTEIAKKILETRKLGQDAENIRQEFYEKTASEKENFESQEKERSVAEIMKEKDLVIVHAIPLFSEGYGSGRGDTGNNPMLKVSMQQKVGFEDSFEMIAGFSPTISTSIPSPDRSNNGLFKRQGVILGEGKILSAQGEDSGSVAHGLYKRIPKYGEGERHTAIQSNINIEDTAKRMADTGYGAKWNELTIENPKIAGLFYDLTEENFNPNNPSFQSYKERGYTQEQIEELAKDHEQRFLKTQHVELLKMKEYSEKDNMPLYAFKNENGKLNKYRIDFSETDKKSDYFNNVLLSEYDELEKNFGKNSLEMNKFLSEKFLPFRKEFPMKPDKNGNYVPEKALYNLIPVTAKDIYESKREISNEEKNKMVEDIKGKGILSEAAEKEISKRLKN